MQSNLFAQLVRAVARIILERTFRYRRITRPSPNPNVLIELGYAAATIGWDRVILVQNTAYGDLGVLPFDLRSRRIVPFNLSAKESRRDERPKLRDQLDSALRNALADMLTPTFWPGSRQARWFGFWHTDRSPTRSSTLFVREVGAAGFMFHLSLIDGSRAGSVSGFAKFIGPDSAYARIAGSDETHPCELKFRRTFDQIRQIHVEESTGCGHWKGMGATFNGVYRGGYDLLFESGALDELDHQRLYGITGEYYRPLVDRFQQVGTGENADTFPATVAIGGAKGLYTIFEAIVMRGENGQLWAAYIDEDIVRYFTTEREFKNRLPKTIEQWRQRFPSKKVVLGSEIVAIPSL